MFKEQLEKQMARYEEVIRKKNKKTDFYNGIYDRWENPVLTRDHIPLTITVTNPEPIFSYPINSTLADFVIASAASIAPTNPLVSIIPNASPMAFASYLSLLSLFLSLFSL